MNHEWINWPWIKVKPRQGFFIPSLDPQATIAEGLRTALPFRYRLWTRVGFSEGRLGVWFYRLGPGQSRPDGSSAS